MRIPRAGRSTMHLKLAAIMAGLGPQGTAAFLAKGAGLSTQLDQRILRRLPDLSF